MKVRPRTTGLLLLAVILLGLGSNCTVTSTPAVTPTALPTQTVEPTNTPTPAPTATPPFYEVLTPPMGWNSFNHFGCNITGTVVLETADAMVSSGMQAVGYQYIIIDDCWMMPTRDTSGDLQPDPQKFPQGMKAVADYVHAKGLKFGLYLDRGTKTCGGYPGSYGYEVRDANQLAAWGVDYLKYDNCNPDPASNLATDYINMHNALEATGRPFVYAMCNWGFPGYWAMDIAQLWRTTSDIKDTWSSMTTIMDANNVHAAFAKPGHWNDPDMLEVGNGGMTDTEYRTHFSMWALMAAPLFAGNDLRNMSQATKDILTAPEVIAVDQDPLGVQGKQISKLTGVNQPEVWAKPLSGANTYAVALLNRSEAPVDITVMWSDIGLPAGPATVHDLWDRADRGVFTDRYTANVPPHGVALVKIVSTGGQ